MHLMIEELYDALREANVTDEKARAAARAVAEFQSAIQDIKATQRLHSWMLTALLGLTTMVLAGTLAVLYRLSGGR